MVVTNAPDRWTAVLAVLAAKRTEIDRAFAAAGLKELEWPERVTAGRWAIHVRPEALAMLRVLTNFEMDSRLVVSLVLIRSPRAMRARPIR